MSTAREAWLAVVQDADGNEETELVTIESVNGEPRTIEMTDGSRITLLEPADVVRQEVAAA